MSYPRYLSDQSGEYFEIVGQTWSSATREETIRPTVHTIDGTPRVLYSFSVEESVAPDAMQVFGALYPLTSTDNTTNLGVVRQFWAASDRQHNGDLMDYNDKRRFVPYGVFTLGGLEVFVYSLLNMGDMDLRPSFITEYKS